MILQTYVKGILHCTKCGRFFFSKRQKMNCPHRYSELKATS